MYEMSTRSYRGEGQKRLRFPHRDSTDHARTDNDRSKDDTRLAATYHALKRLADRAADKMAKAAIKTDFKDAALWRDRRDSVLGSMRDLELEAHDVARKITSVSVGDRKREGDCSS